MKRPSAEIVARIEGSFPPFLSRDTETSVVDPVVMRHGAANGPGAAMFHCADAAGSTDPVRWACVLPPLPSGARHRVNAASRITNREKDILASVVGSDFKRPER